MVKRMCLFFLPEGLGVEVALGQEIVLESSFSLLNKLKFSVFFSLLKNLVSCVLLSSVCRDLLLLAPAKH